MTTGRMIPVPKIVAQEKATPTIKNTIRIIAKTFLLDVVYVAIVVGVLLNGSYFLLAIAAQPLLAVVEEVYLTQQAQGITTEEALAALDLPITEQQLWFIIAKMGIILVGTFCAFAAVSGYFKAKVWSLLIQRDQVKLIPFIHSASRL